MFRVIVQVSCMLVLASVFYDVMSCNRFYKTHTYKYIKYVGGSKYGKMLLKKWKKARRICYKSLGQASCNAPTDNRAIVNQVEPCMDFADWPTALNKIVISLVHYVIVCFGEKMSSFQHSILSCNGLMAGAKALVAGAYRQCKQTTADFMTKIMPSR